MAGHVYATLTDLKNTIRDDGANATTGLGTTNDTLLRGVLEAVSELIDEKMERSEYGSGFGPRTGTNQYDGSGGSRLRLRDDLLTATTVTLRASTASSTTQTPVIDTDFYLENGDGAYSPGPYRTLHLHGQGIASFTTGYRVTEIAGVWGYQNVTTTATATASAIASTSTTTVTVSAGAEFSACQTLLIDTEQLYVRTVSGTTLTVTRGVNGTTAATHGAAAAIAIYQYPARVREVCLAIAQKRWQRRSGGDAGEPGLSIPGTRPESEEGMIRRSLAMLRLKEMV